MNTTTYINIKNYELSFLKKNFLYKYKQENLSWKSTFIKLCSLTRTTFIKIILVLNKSFHYYYLKNISYMNNKFNYKYIYKKELVNL